MGSGEELSITTEVKNIVTKEDDIETTSILTDLIEHGNESTTDVVITLVNTESGKEKRKKDKNEDTIYIIDVEGIGEMQLHVVTNNEDVEHRIETDESQDKCQNYDKLAQIKIENSTKNTLESIKIEEPVRRKNENETENQDPFSFSTIAMSVY